MGTGSAGRAPEHALHSRWSTRSLRISLLTQKKNPKQIRAWGSTVVQGFWSDGVRVSGDGRCCPADLVTHR